MKFVFDTSILIDHLRGIKDAKSLIEKVEKKEIEGVISVVTEAELLSPKICDNTEEREMVENLLRIFRKVELNKEIAKIAAKFKREYGISLLDSIIAVTTFGRVKIVEIRKPY
jgi:predicted nucleic acid-binding protein